MNREAKIYLISFIILVGTSISIAYHYFQGFYLGNPYPYNTFLFTPMYRFSDFTSITNEIHNLNPYFGATSGQYPFLLMVGYLFSLIPESYSYIVFLVMVTGLFLYFNRIRLWNFNWYRSITPIFIITFLSYPFLFTIDRGNFEILVFIFVLAFSFYFVKKQYAISAILLSCAIAMKVLPALLLILFIPEKKWRELVLCIACSIILTLFSLICFKGGLLANLTYLLNFSNISSNWNFMQFVSIEPGTFIQRGVSLLTLIKIFVLETSITLPQFIVANFSKLYVLSAGILLLPILFYVIFVEKILWKRTALAVFAMLLLPPISADYKLLYVFIPLFIYINTEKISYSDILYISLFGLLLIPKDYYYFKNVLSDAYISNAFVHDVSVSIVINILIMILMSLMLIVSGCISWIDRRRAEHMEHPNGMVRYGEMAEAK